MVCECECECVWWGGASRCPRESRRGHLFVFLNFLEFFGFSPPNLQRQCKAVKIFTPLPPHAVNRLLAHAKRHLLQPNGRDEKFPEKSERERGKEVLQTIHSIPLGMQEKTEAFFLKKAGILQENVYEKKKRKKNYRRDKTMKKKRKKKEDGNNCELEMHFYDIVYQHEYSA